MPLKTFPSGTRQWVSLPADKFQDPGGTRSFELPQLPTMKIRANAKAADDVDRFYPLLKVDLVAATTIAEASCGKIPFFVNTGIRTFSWWLATLNPATQQEPDSTPPVIELQFRKVVAAHPHVAVTGFLAADSYSENGLIVQLSNLLCTGCEIWGRVPPVDGSVQTDMEMQVVLVFDRQPSKDDISYGDFFS